MAAEAARLHVLVACADCRRRYDASELPLGSLFRCHCGQLVQVPAVTARDATVVRCSACGAPRDANATACGHCRADFTAHERDMHTTCPECMARVSDRARFCHSCGTRIGTPTVAGRPTERPCPACAERPEPQTLVHRELGRPPIAVLECPCCAGLWLTPEAVDAVVARARAVTPPVPGARAERPMLPAQAGPLYRRCPMCAKMMSRTNYGRRSGVIVDRCLDHGVWFDEQELAAVVAWLRGGGEARAAATDREEARAAAGRERFKPRIGGMADDARQQERTPEWIGLLGHLLS